MIFHSKTRRTFGDIKLCNLLLPSAISTRKRHGREPQQKAIRRYVKKKSDLSSFPREHFKMVETKLRARFIKCLNFKTPAEMFEREILKTKKTTGL